MRSLLALSLMAGAVLVPHVARGQAAAVTVSIDAVDFAPAVITVTPGTTVTWVHNDGEIGHNVSSPGNFRSPPMTGGDRFAFTFASAGEYSYGCSLHPSLMVGLVRVTSAEPAPAATAPPAPPPATALAPTTSASPSGGPLPTAAPAGPTARSTESAPPSPSPTATSAAEPRPLPTETAGAFVPEATAQARPLAPSAGEAAQEGSSLTPLVLGGLAVAVAVAGVLAGGRIISRR